jgi:hypothetical protein
MEVGRHRRIAVGFWRLPKRVSTTPAAEVNGSNGNDRQATTWQISLSAIQINLQSEISNPRFLDP